MNSKQLPLIPLNERSPLAQELIDTLLPFAETRRHPKGIRVALIQGETKMCHLILSGAIEVHRTSDELLIVNAVAPAIFGLSIHDAYIVTTEPCQIASLTQEEAQRIFTEKEMWGTVTHHMMLITNKLYSYCKQLSAPTTYEAICNQLMELMNEPEAIRNNIAVERYIREKTHISRSSVMKILADLKTGGYIVTEKGRLLEVRRLPLKY